MAQTTNYNIVKPDVGASENTWGTALNTATDLIDSTIKTVSDAIPTSIVATSITDTPSSLGTANQQLKINAGGSALEFFTPSVTNLSDTPSALGTANQILKMNSGATALEWATDASGSSGIALTNLSVSTGSASTGGSLSYNNSSGVFTFVPTDWATLMTTITGTRQGSTSSDMTVTGGGTFTYAHGLSASPFMVQWAIKCSTAEHGYSVGDIIYGTDTVANASHSPSVYVDSGDTTNVKGVFPSLGTFQIASKASGVVGNTVTTTSGRWTMHLKVMK